MTITTQEAAHDDVSFSVFKTWLKGRQQACTEAMTVTTGDAFSQHLETLLMTVEAMRTVALFEAERSSAAHPT